MMLDSSLWIGYNRKHISGKGICAVQVQKRQFNCMEQVSLGDCIKGQPSVDLGDEENHYSEGAIWNGDWYSACFLHGWFGNVNKPRHYAVSLGRQSSRDKYAHALLFLPMTSMKQDGVTCLYKIPGGTVDCLPRDTYVTTRRLLMWEDQLESDARASFMGNMPEPIMRGIRMAWRARLESFRKR